MPTTTYRPFVGNVTPLKRGRKHGKLKTCDQCGGWFTSFQCGGRTRKAWTRFCSEKCVSVSAAWAAGTPAALAKELAALSRIARNWKIRPDGRRFRTRRLHARLKNACRTCGALLPNKAGGRPKKYCNRRCAPRPENQKRLNKNRKRAAYYGVPYEPVDKLAVFDAFGWRCAFCGEPTPKDLLGTTNEFAPELDHRVPMSRGGAHAWDNVQLLCRGCNSAKGNSTAPAWRRAWRPRETPGGGQKLGTTC